MTKPIEIYTNLFSRFKSLGARLDNVIDIGCHEGKWSQRFKEVYPESNLYLIDGNKLHEEKLNKLGTFIHGYVGQKKEQRTFYTSAGSDDETGNSLYKENSNTPFRKVTIETQPLIDLVPEQRYDYIKMDIQGAELEVIEGSLKIFLNTKWVQLECPVFQNNKDAPNFEQIINYMANSAFKVFDIENIYYNNRLMGIDIIFNNQTLKQAIPTEQKTLIYAHHDASA